MQKDLIPTFNSCSNYIEFLGKVQSELVTELIEYLGDYVYYIRPLGFAREIRIPESQIIKTLARDGHLELLKAYLKQNDKKLEECHVDLLLGSKTNCDQIMDCCVKWFDANEGPVNVHRPTMPASEKIIKLIRDRKLRIDAEDIVKYKNFLLLKILYQEKLIKTKANPDIFRAAIYYADIRVLKLLYEENCITKEILDTAAFNATNEINVSPKLTIEQINALLAFSVEKTWPKKLTNALRTSVLKNCVSSYADSLSHELLHKSKSVHKSRQDVINSVMHEKYTNLTPEFLLKLALAGKVKLDLNCEECIKVFVYMPFNTKKVISRYKQLISRGYSLESIWDAFKKRLRPSTLCKAMLYLTPKKDTKFWSELEFATNTVYNFTEADLHAIFETGNRDLLAEALTQCTLEIKKDFAAKYDSYCLLDFLCPFKWKSKK